MKVTITVLLKCSLQTPTCFYLITTLLYGAKAMVKFSLAMFTTGDTHYKFWHHLIDRLMF